MGGFSSEASLGLMTRYTSAATFKKSIFCLWLIQSVGVEPASKGVPTWRRLPPTPSPDGHPQRLALNQLRSGGFVWTLPGHPNSSPAGYAGCHCHDTDGRRTLRGLPTATRQGVSGSTLQPRSPKAPAGPQPCFPGCCGRAQRVGPFPIVTLLLFFWMEKCLQINVQSGAWMTLAL